MFLIYWFITAFLVVDGQSALPGPALDANSAVSTIKAVADPVSDSSSSPTSEAPTTTAPPAPAVTGQAVPAPVVTVQAVPAPLVTVQAVPAPAVTGQAVPAPAVTGQAVPAPAVTGQAVPAPAVTGQAVPAPAVTGQAVPAPAVTGQALPAPAVTVQAVPAPATTKMAESPVLPAAVTTARIESVAVQVTDSASTSSTLPSTTSLPPEQTILQFLTKPNELPIFKVLANRDQYTSTTKVIYDRNNPVSGNFTEWYMKQFSAIEMSKAWENDFPRYSADMKTHANAWRMRLKANFDIELSQPVLAPVYSDTTMVVPLGMDKMLYSWLLLQSLLTSTVLPQEIILVTGIVPNRPVPAKWLTLYQYILDEVLPYLPEPVNIKWVVYDGKGGAAISRVIGVSLAKTPFSFYHDADDVIGVRTIEAYIETLRAHPNVDQVLHPYTGVGENSTEVENLAKFLVSENMRRTQMNIELVLDHMVRRYANTWFDMHEYLSSYNETEAVGFVNAAFENRETQDLTTVNKWPQLVHFADCESLVQAIKKAEAAAQLSPEAAASEKLALDWFVSQCGDRSHKPQFVAECHNGWSAFKTEVVRQMPAIAPTFGEDSLMTFMISRSNHTSVCLRKASGGLYVVYRDGQRKVLGDMIFPTD